MLGDMFELGPFAPALHTGVGECLGKARIDCLVAVGELAEHIAQGARNSGVPLVYHCKDKAEAKPVLDQLVRPGSTILVKASRGMELEELTAYLLSITRRRSDPQGPSRGRTVWKARLREGPSQRPTQERQRTVMIDIAISGLVKEFEVGKKILDGLTFQVDSGERVGLLGKNGCGKTTLLRILTGQMDWDEGEVVLAPDKRVG